MILVTLTIPSETHVENKIAEAIKIIKENKK